jgi:hypothetical protein
MENFKSFITEQTETKLKILVLSDEPEKSELFHTAKRIKEEGAKLGHEVYVVFLDGAYIKNEGDIKTIHNVNDKKGFVIDKNDKSRVNKIIITNYIIQRLLQFYS